MDGPFGICTLCSPACSCLGRRLVQVWAVRDNVSELAFGKPAMQLLKWEFYLLTFVLVAIAYLLSIFIPSGVYSINPYLSHTG